MLRRGFGVELVYKGKKITEPEAVDILNTGEARRLIQLVKSQYVKGDFPFSRDDWKRFSNEASNQVQAINQLRFLKGLPAWGKQYVLALNMTNDTQKRRYQAFIDCLNSLLENNEVPYEYLLHDWRELVGNINSNALDNGDTSTEDAKYVRDTLQEIDRQNINLNVLYWNLFKNTKYMSKARNGLLSTQDNAKHMLRDLVEADIRDDEQMVENLDDARLADFISNLREKSINFTDETFEQYKKAWNIRWLSVQMKRMIRTSNERFKKYGLKNVNRPKVQLNTALDVQDFFEMYGTPNFDFPFSLVSWMALGETLAGGNKVKALNMVEMKKLQIAFPEYVDYLIDSVGRYDVSSFKNHLDAWGK